MTKAEPSTWLLHLLDHVEGQVAFGDTKAGQLLSADSILLAALVLVAKDLRDDLSTPSLVAGTIAAGFLILSLLAVLLSVAPAQGLLADDSAWKSPWWSGILRQRDQTTPETTNLTHFASIVSQGPDDHADLSLVAGTERLERDLLLTIYGKSAWAVHKYRWLDRAVKFTLLAIAAVAIALVMASLSWMT